MAQVSLCISENDRILILAPHPDDESIGVGGLLLLYGNLCDVVVMTDGSRGNNNVTAEKEMAIRKSQFEEAMSFANIQNYRWLGYKDGELFNQPRCMDSIEFDKYTKVFLPAINDNHPDHTATFTYAIKAINDCKISAEVYQYEVHVPLHEVDTYIDITDVIENKGKLIRLHKDQVTQVEYDAMAWSLAKYRAAFCNASSKYYETFLKTSSVSSDEVAATSEREKLIQKYRSFYRFFVKYICLKQRDVYIGEYLYKNGYKRVAIYGYGDIGKILERDLSRSRVEIVEIVDQRNVHSIYNRTVSLHESDKDVDLIITTQVQDVENIKENLIKQGYKSIIEFEKIIEILAAE